MSHVRREIVAIKWKGIMMNARTVKDTSPILVNGNKMFRDAYSDETLPDGPRNGQRFSIEFDSGYVRVTGDFKDGELFPVPIREQS